MARFSSSRPRGKTFRPRTFWTGGPQSYDVGTSLVPTLTQTAGGATGLVNLAVGIGIYEALTCRRIRGSFVWQLSGAAAEAFGYTAAIGKCNVEAFTAGVASLPSPQLDPSEDWLWVKKGGGVLATGTESDQLGIYLEQVEIDCKSQRRMTGSEVLYGIVSVNESAAATLIGTFFMDTRILWSDSAK